MSLDAVRQLEERIAIEHELGKKAPGSTPAGVMSVISPVPSGLSHLPILLASGRSVTFLLWRARDDGTIAALISWENQVWRGLGQTPETALDKAVELMRGGYEASVRENRT